MTKTTAIAAAANFRKAKGGDRAQAADKAWATRIANRWAHPWTGNIAPVAFQYVPKA